MNFVRHLNPFTKHHDNHILKAIYPAEEFKAILERERARSDRSGERFSLVVFYTDTPHKDQKDMAAHLVQILTHRVRSIDVVGWVERRQIGIALPNTSGEGARKFAEDISKKIAAKTQAPAFQVFTYPSDMLPGLNERSEARPYSPSTPPGNTSPDPKVSRAELHKREALMEHYECLFARRMPVWKRIIDIIGAIFGMALLFPLFFLIAVIIKIVSPGPAFFKQERIGYLGRPFNCFKFRTMQTNADSSIHMQHIAQLFNDDGALVKLDDSDTRIIPFGKLLRKTGLDELPQLVNVLRGEMSLVGPRPDVPYSVEHYKQWHLKRFDANPGLSGLWQTSHKNTRTFNEMTRLDITYARRSSFWLDTKILLKTFSTVIRQMANGA